MVFIFFVFYLQSVIYVIYLIKYLTNGLIIVLKFILCHDTIITHFYLI
jgi:hypothetical protein